MKEKVISILIKKFPFLYSFLYKIKNRFFYTCLLYLKKEKSFIKFYYKNISFKIFINLKNGGVDRELFMFKNYEKRILDIFLEEINKNSIVLDVGGNIGFHSLFLSKISKKVISFEPIKKIYSQFKKSVKENNISNIKLYNLGLSNKNEEKIIYENFENMGASSLINKRNFNKKEKINLVKFDDFIKNKKIDFIKMDIEGYEYFALKGMKKTLKKYKPKIIFEFSPCFYKEIDGKISENILLELKKLNYKIFSVNSKKEIRDINQFIKKHQFINTNLFCK